MRERGHAPPPGTDTLGELLQDSRLEFLEIIGHHFRRQRRFHIQTLTLAFPQSELKSAKELPTLRQPLVVSSIDHSTLSAPSSSPDPLAQLRQDLRARLNQIIGASELLQKGTESSIQNPQGSDLKSIQLNARQLLELVDTKFNAEALAGVVRPSASGHTTAHRRATDAPSDGHGETGFFARYDGHVLVADHNEQNREMLIRRLRRQGMKVEIATDGVRTLELVRTQQIDVVLLDIMMPGLDGLSVLQQLKADPQTRHVPVIMVSELDELESVIRCIEAGAEDYLPKPFNPVLLRARITACLEKKLLREAEQRYLKTIEETQRRLDAELAEAANYVRSIFPPSLETPLRVDWKYQPSTELGGDAFGYHWIDRDHFAVYLLDVCGHGVGASLLSIAAINVIRSGSLPNTDFRDPGAVLSALNNAFPMERQNNMYFTLWYGVYHAPSRTLRHGSGGHPPALLLEPSKASSASSQQLRSAGLIVGAMQSVVYSAQSLSIPAGAVLLVLSDGCYEIQDPLGQFMDFAEFETFMQAHGELPDGLEKLFSWVRKRHGDGPLDDDFSIVRIQF
ncbi:MAG: serine/threonine protein phosphatase [Verrucomicrobia bacterium]|nr:MAG: serine/threonine protein phosphatase [Verrucomicrobiota bacterium]